MFRDKTKLVRGFAPPWAGRHRLFYVFSWLLWPKPELFGWFVPTYSLIKFISHTGCGGNLPTRSRPSRDCREICSVLSGSRPRPVSSCTRGAPLSNLRTHPDIDGCAMSYPEFHIAHGGRLRPIDFARGYGIIPTTLSQTLSIG